MKWACVYFCDAGEKEVGRMYGNGMHYPWLRKRQITGLCMGDKRRSHHLCIMAECRDPVSDLLLILLSPFFSSKWEKFVLQAETVEQVQLGIALQDIHV